MVETTRGYVTQRNATQVLADWDFVTQADQEHAFAESTTNTTPRSTSHLELEHLPPARGSAGTAVRPAAVSPY